MARHGHPADAVMSEAETPATNPRSPVRLAIFDVSARATVYCGGSPKPEALLWAATFTRRRVCARNLSSILQFMIRAVLVIGGCRPC
jgi:hypothetical protein